MNEEQAKEMIALLEKIYSKLRDIDSSISNVDHYIVEELKEIKVQVKDISGVLGN